MDWAGRKASRGGTAMSPQGCSCRHIYGEGTLLLCFINLRRAKIPSGQLEASLWQYINMHHGELANAANESVRGGGRAYDEMR